MIKNSFYFGVDEEYNVEFQIDNDSTKYIGKLVISPGKVPCLDIDDNFLKNDDKIIKLIFCKSENDSFLLLDSDNYYHRIYPKYIIKGNHFNSYKDIQFSGLHLYLSNYYKWIISNNLKFDFRKIRKINKFNIKLTRPDSKIIEISNSYNFSIKEIEDEKRKSIIENYPTIDIFCINNTFTIKEIIDLAYEMRQIFSFLMGYSLNILYLWGYVIKKYNNKDYQEWIPIYTVSKIKNSETLDYNNYCLIQSKFINKNKWQKIFNNFYSEEKYSDFKLKWSRLLGLLDYSDIWDYEIAGYFSLFESYLDKFKSKQKSKELPISNKKFNKFKEELNLQLDNFLKINNFTKRQLNQYKNVIISMKRYILKLCNYDYPTVNQKYERWFLSINKNITDIINMNIDDFNLIKKFKNDTSHANKINYEDYDTNKLFIIKNKISLFLFFQIYKELGFTNNDFIKFLKITYHPLRRNSEINEEALDRIIGKVPFIEIRIKDFNKIYSLKSKWNIIFEHDINNNYFFNENMTKKYEKKYLTEIKNYKFLDDFVKYLYADKKYKDIKYIGPIYITNKELNKSLKLHNVFFVKI